jgi:ABC-2 type transport system permease protein
VLLAVLVVAFVAYLEGRFLLGKGPVTGTVSVSGTTLSQGELLQRTIVAFGYVTLSMLSVAAIALLLSTMTDSAIAAALGTIGFLIASTVLLGLDAAHAIRPYLPTRYWLSFVDLFRDPIRWEGVVRGVLGQLSYLVVFLTAAWANFASKDINS